MTGQRSSTNKGAHTQGDAVAAKIRSRLAIARIGAAPDAQWPGGVTPTAEYSLALDYLRNETGHLFVTGRAGTGKSTLLRALRDLVPGELIIVAPTGLAAVNVGGQTIHSFFGFPPRLIRPDDIRRSRNGASCGASIPRHR